MGEIELGTRCERDLKWKNYKVIACTLKKHLLALILN